MLSVTLKDIKFDSPILTASGTFGYGDEISDLVDVNQLGGIITKSVTLHPREGNPPPRIAETRSGMLNSIGLANVGVQSFCEEKLPVLNDLKTRVIINIAGYGIDDYVKTLRIIETTGGNHVGYEVNISCPNVKEGGMQFGVSAEMTEKLTGAMRENTNRLLIMKLSPNVTRIEDIALAAESGGADAVSAINTVVAMGVDVWKKRPLLNTVFGGLSGPAIKPIALANVHKIYRVVSIPVIGIGGISTAQDVLEFIIAGANMVQIGTANFANPAAGVEIRNQLNDYCREQGISEISQLKGSLNYH